MFKNRIANCSNGSWAFLLLLVLIAAACQDPSTNKSTSIVGGDTQEDYSDEISWLIDSEQIIYSIEDEDPLQDTSLNLGVKVEVSGTSSLRSTFGSLLGVKRVEYKSILPADAIKSFKSDSLPRHSDSFGSYTNLRIDKTSADFDVGSLQKSALLQSPGVMAVPRRSLESSLSAKETTVELRKISEVDANITGIAYGNIKNARMKDLVDNLNKHSGDPANPLHGKDAFRFAVEARRVDPEIIVARLRYQFGEKYSIKHVSGNSFEMKPMAEVIRIEYLADNTGKVAGGMRSSHLKLALQNPDFLGPNQGTIIIAPKGSIDADALIESGLYKRVRELDPKLLTTDLDVRSVGARIREMAPYWIQRHDYPEGKFPLPEESAMRAAPAELNQRLNELTYEFSDGYRVDLNPGLSAAKHRLVEYIGQGAWGSVKKVEIDGKLYAEKTMFGEVDFNKSTEIANAVFFGKYDIGPKVYRADTHNSKATYLMDLADSDASKFRMNEKQILSYGARQEKLRSLGKVALDDKPANILIRGNEAMLHDFSFVHSVTPGRMPSLRDYGTYAPKEAEAVLATGVDTKVGYAAANLQSFYFGLNVLHSRLGVAKFASLTSLPNVSKVIDQRRVIDGDALAVQLQGKHLEAGMTKQAYDELVNMIKNDTAARPSVDSFINRFKNETFIASPPPGP